MKKDTLGALTGSFPSEKADLNQENAFEKNTHFRARLSKAAVLFAMFNGGLPAALAGSQAPSLPKSPNPTEKGAHLAGTDGVGEVVEIRLGEGWCHSKSFDFLDRSHSDVLDFFDVPGELRSYTKSISRYEKCKK